MPEVSILLPVRDALPYLGASLRSLARQSVRDHEVIAVDDGSTDGSGEALDRAARADSRLRVVHTPARGLPTALNDALSRVQSPRVARHDADDVSHRRRLEHQLAHLDAHRSVAVVGCRVRLFPRAAVGPGMRRWAEWHNALLSHPSMMNELLIDSPLAHGSAMIRTSWLERVGGWAERGWPEDLDLWLRLAGAGARFGKLPEVLYGWRQHAASATRRDPRYLATRFMSLKLDALEHGMLRGARELTLVGVGRSLERWREPLERSWRTRLVTAGRPDAALRGSLYPPVILVFGSYPVRDRWRRALTIWGMNEREQFIFVA